jgi:pilus assembly protein Flp/PilA
MSNLLLPVYGVLFTLQGRVEDHFQQRKDRGATAVEYGLLVGLIAVVIILAVTALGGRLKELFNSIVTSLGGTPAA